MADYGLSQQGRSIWSEVVAGLSRDPKQGLNLATECSDRWRKRSNKAALVVHAEDGSSKDWTHGELGEASVKLARLFARMGLRQGDRVAGVLSRQPEAWISAIAAWRSGIAYVPLYTGFGDAAIATRLEAADAKLVVVDQHSSDTVDLARSRLTGDPAVLTVRSTPASHRDDFDFWDQLERQPADWSTVDTWATDPACVIFTSGTTGDPKGCIVPHSGFLALVPWFLSGVGLGDSGVLFSGADPGWSFGLIALGAVPLSRGVTVMLRQGAFDATAWMQSIRDTSPDHFAAAPSVFRRMIPALEDAPVRPLAATSGGEPMDEATAAGWYRAVKRPIRNVYGQTEIGAVLADRLEDKPIPGALGRPVPGFEVALVDDEGRFLDGPREGVIAVRRPQYQQTSGYLRGESQWQRLWDGDWFITGDVARRDEEGVWWFVARKDDVVVTSGINVSPSEVEAVLTSHPSVVDAAVVSGSHGGREVVRAVLVLGGESEASQPLITELQDAVRARIGRHATPRLFNFVDSLPRTEAGKLRRSLLRDNSAATPGPLAPGAATS